MDIPLKNYLNVIKFGLVFKKKLKDSNGESLDELISLAIEERGILYKLIQHLYPNKLPDYKVAGKTVTKSKIISFIEHDLKINFNDHFSSLSEPVYCASIGQVHKAKIISTDQDIAIKVQYPHIKQSIRSQINLLKIAAATAKFGPIAKWKVDLDSYIHQVENRLKEELDYSHELNNLMRTKQFNSSNNHREPLLFEKYCTSQIFIQPWIEGLSINEVAQKKNYEEKKILAETIAEDFLKQVFLHGFFQGDTNFSNFIIDKNANVHWIDYGNWCELSTEMQQSIFTIIFQTIAGEDINYLGHFEKIGFDLAKLRYIQNLLPILVSILFEPFLINRNYDMSFWNLEERIQNLLGENKWWFRSSGNSALLELMKSFYGIVTIVKYLKVNINWQKIFLTFSSQFNIATINKNLISYENDIPAFNLLAKNLVIHIFKNDVEHVKIELPATSLLDLENCIPDDIKDKLLLKNLDIAKIKFAYLEKGLVPGEVFSLETAENTATLTSITTRFQVYLT